MFSPEDLQPQLDALRDLGMGNDDIRDVYHAAPSVMALDVDMQMKPAIAFLQVRSPPTPRERGQVAAIPDESAAVGS